MVILTPWGLQSAVAACSADGRWYAVLRDALPSGVVVPGAVASTLEESVELLRVHCQDAVRERSA
jgi:hypothetical protein